MNAKIETSSLTAEEAQSFNPKSALHANAVLISPVSFAQRRLWFLDQVEPGGTTYNMQSVVRLTGKLDVDLLEAALNLILARHESLRTRFASHQGLVRTTQLGFKPSTLENGHPSSETVARCHETIIAILAGKEAQRKFNPRSVRSWHYGPDHEGIIEILTRLHGYGDEAGAVYKYLEIRARNLVSAPEHWPNVKLVAKELLEKGTLTGEEIKAVIVESNLALANAPVEEQKRLLGIGSV